MTNHFDKNRIAVRRTMADDLPVWWVCFDCDETGKGDRGAEKHTRDTKHGTTTQTYPPPPCPACEWATIRDWSNRFLRYVLHNPCDDCRLPDDTPGGR